jgi:hypothetical protein
MFQKLVDAIVFAVLRAKQRWDKTEQSQNTSQLFAQIKAEARRRQLKS